MNYIGSKYSLRDFLEEGILKNVNSDCKVFCDVFAGTGVVGAHFKQKGFKIISNDIQYYSFCLNRALVGINQLSFILMAILNDLIPATQSCDTTRHGIGISQ